MTPREAIVDHSRGPTRDSILSAVEMNVRDYIKQL